MTTLGTVNEEELKALETVFRKKVAIENLFIVLCERRQTLSDDANYESMYNRLLDDYGKVQMEMGNWWSEISNKYKWTISFNDRSNGRWYVDFSSGLVSIINT